MRLAVIAAMLIWIGAAFGAHARNPLPGAFSGSYKVTVKATNTKATPTRWIYAARPSCSSLCHAVTFRDRLVSEKSWRKTAVTFRWNGKEYALSKKLPNYSDCRAKSGSTVKKGYDVTSKLQFRIRTVTSGRIVRWLGTGRDDYVPNAAGRKHHCTAGAYLYTLNAVAQ